jgi:thiol-disulfide isomerase/thioredoxin
VVLRVPSLTRGDDIIAREHVVRIAWPLLVVLVALAVSIVGPPVTVDVVPRAAAADASRFVPWRGETPVLALKGLDGRSHALGDYRGRVVLLNFWATWCEPCREEMPSIRTLRETLAGLPFDVLVVNHGESPARVHDFLAKERLDLVALLDPNKEAARAWRVRVLPGSFLVDREGRVRYSVIGEFDWASTAALEAVRALLPATTTSGGRGGR